MEQNCEIIKNLTYQTDEKSLLEEIKLAITDYFDCEIADEDGSALMLLANGQRFRLSLTEIK
ncbi:MAG: hypothetical protein ACI4MQ_08030 [Candidatus Coproplasma sp.]